MTGPAKESVISVAAARLSHEILNALTGIGGALEVLVERLPDDTDSQDVLSRIRGEIRRLEQSVTELNRFAARSEPRLRTTNLHRVIDRALERQPALASTRVRRDFADDVPWVRADETLLLDALERLFRNAYDAMPAGGTLTVVTRSSQARVRVAVRDTGSGLPPEPLQNAFEPFYSSKTRGLGLGLAIARRHIEAHGGSIEAARVDEGGSEFTITLPICPPRGPQP